MPDFSTFDDNRADVIPDRTVAAVQLILRHGNIGPGGVLTRAKDGASEGLDCVFQVIDGPHRDRKIFMRLTLMGSTPRHAEAGDIAHRLLKQILISARNIRPVPKVPIEKQPEEVRKAFSAEYSEFDGLRFLARIGVIPPKEGYAAKNKITGAVEPHEQGYVHLPQTPASQPPADTSEPATAPVPISRPAWAS